MILDKRKVYTFFKNRYLIKKATNGWYSFDCPFCVDGEMKRKHAVHFGHEFTKCWAGCGFRGTIADFVIQSEGVTYMEAKALLNEQEEANIDLEVFEGIITSDTKEGEVELPIGYVGLLEGRGVIGDRARNTLIKRGFDLNVLDAMGFGYCNEHPANKEDKENDYFGYIIIPFKRRSKLLYFIGRDFMGNFLRYKNPATERYGIGKAELLFNEDALELYKRVWVTEGWSDAMTMGKTGVSTQGWSLSPIQQSKLMRSRAEELVFIADKGFYAEAVRTAMSFLDVKPLVKVICLDHEPGTAEENKDANSIGYDRVLELYKDTQPLTEELAYSIIF